jgi:hypothetical protein
MGGDSFLYLESKVEVWYERFLFGGEDLAWWEEFSKGLVLDLAIESKWSRNSIN